VEEGESVVSLFFFRLENWKRKTTNNFKELAENTLSSVIQEEKQNREGRRWAQSERRQRGGDEEEKKRVRCRRRRHNCRRLSPHLFLQKN
jgi:hypothetical protein